jgi:hypothetical protein
MTTKSKSKGNQQTLTVGEQRIELFLAWEKVINQHVKLGPAINQALIGVLDYSKPSRLKVTLFEKGSRPGKGKIAHSGDVRAMQAQRMRWLTVKVKTDADGNDKRRLRLERKQADSHTAYTDMHFQTFIIPTDEVPDRKELARLFGKKPGGA